MQSPNRLDTTGAYDKKRNAETRIVSIAERPCHQLGSKGAHALTLTEKRPPDVLTELSAQIERITYTNPENGYTVARVKVYGRSELVTIVGNLADPSPGEILWMRGEWSQHPKFGEQFKVVHYETRMPATAYGIQKYLGSGLIKGVGPVTAKRIVKQFGTKTLDIIENAVERLAEVDGIGAKRIRMIRDAWAQQKEIRDVMLFLQSHGVSAAYATKIFKHYGDQSIQVVQANPYRLAMDIYGVGFITADTIAAKLGFEKNAPVRLQAGVIHVLHQLSEDGHVYSPYEELIARAMEILEVDREDIAVAIAVIAEQKEIVIEDLNDNPATYLENNKAVYLEKYYFCETRICRSLNRLLTTPKVLNLLKPQNAVEWVQHQLSIRLAPKQISAVKTALEEKVMVITGGPGTGKTTIINAIIKIFATVTPRVMLAAPTGRAAKRLSETTGCEAKTVHRLLEYSMAGGGFQRNADAPLVCDLLIVDEASMIDTVLMHHLLKAVPPQATFILVGDIYQLPSVGAGNILGDIIGSGAVTVVTLNEIFRQAKNSRIIVNAHLINQGVIPQPAPPGAKSDFYFIQRKDDQPEKILDTLLELACSRIPARFGWDPVNDIQILTPMHRGLLGATNLNTALQERLNPKNAAITRGGRTYRLGDKVMQIKNNYDKEIFNGDIGRIRRISPETQEIVINFDGSEIIYDYADMDEIVHAYAVSVHKAQGSEYPVVIMPVTTQHSIMLQRNLIYTAVTRGRKFVVLVGSRRALAIGIKNDKTQKRYTRLDWRLAGIADRQEMLFK